MPTANDNNAYLAIDGVDVSGLFTDAIELEMTVDTEDITRGAGATHKQRAAKLIDGKIKFVIGYDTDSASTYIARMKPGQYVITYGPQGNATGMPKHEGAYIVTSVKGINTDIQKTKKVFEIDAEQADKPTATLDTDTF